jgi:N-alpha-acetyl-L-2,4-diaminobutyrate deacetylase
VAKPSRITTRVDYAADGKQQGYLDVPHSRDDSAWGAVRIPITVVKNGDGPTILFTGGNHGDEYEGSIALMKLAGALESAEVRGRVIVVPALNLPAVRRGTRLSPIDGRNMNRVFPGRRDGTVTEMIADYVTRHVLPMADVVVDIHSGGKTLDFVPSAVEMGKIFLSSELGGGGTATAGSVAIAETGVGNLLRHFGLIDGEIVRREDRGEPPTRLMHTPAGDCFTVAEDAGILEILVDLGGMVSAGDPIGRVHFFESVHRPPRLYRAARDGMLICRHAPGLIQPGDCLALLAADYPAE